MKSLALATLMFFGTVLAAAPALAQSSPAKAASAITIPVTGAGGGSTFAGTFKLQQFALSQGQVVANGLLTGIVTGANGATTSVVQTVSLPVQIPDPSCQILHLDLGPLSLNLLGLQVNLSEIVLNVTAQSGAGNLLGNLLCDVAGLLNNPASLANLLNQIL
ncbi:MAG TPA: hypothetical protein VH138_07695, partial [Vicinamibacterales bacterium]|nr:hypothetical protein [Vicinamibacterales bacterium]